MPADPAVMANWTEEKAGRYSEVCQYTKRQLTRQGNIYHVVHRMRFSRRAKL